MGHASMYDRDAQEDPKAGWDDLHVPSLRLYLSLWGNMAHIPI